MYNGKICIIGHFGEGQNFLDGQTIKTKVLFNSLNKLNRFDKIETIDTYNWKSNPIKLVLMTFYALQSCSNILVLFSQNGMKVFFPLLYIMNLIFKRHIHHIVIGGNLASLIENHSSWKRYLKSFDGNYVETISMKIELEELGLKNVIVLSNFKELNIITECQLPKNYDKPYKLCTFSRVMKEKGIEDAIDSVIRVNTEAGHFIYSLDIYGQIDSNYAGRFEKIMKEVPNYIKYEGVVQYDKSVEILKEYYLLLFPTYFDGEGFPGTLIDALSSGLPTIATDWHYNSEILRENETGRLIPTHDIEALISALKDCSENTQIVLNMKKECVKEACKYLPKNALLPLIANIK